MPPIKRLGVHTKTNSGRIFAQQGCKAKFDCRPDFDTPGFQTIHSYLLLQQFEKQALRVGSTLSWPQDGKHNYSLGVLPGRSRVRMNFLGGYRTGNPERRFTEPPFFTRRNSATLR
jgi:hypothetical protein